MKTQNMQWGYIEWFKINDDRSAGSSMNIGMCVIMPGQRQQRHLHFGEEQFLYTLEGNGTHIINGAKLKFTVGDFVYIENGSYHETINTGDKPIRELLISNPVDYDMDVSANVFEDTVFSGNLYAAIEAIKEQLMELYKAPFAIFDNDWEIIFQNDYYPKFCIERCNPSADTGCECLKSNIMGDNYKSEYMQFVCGYGMTVYNFHINFHDKKIGTIRGGHFFLSGSGSKYRKDIYDTPQSSANGVKNMFRKIIKSIKAYCEFDQTRVTLEDRENMLLEEQDHQKKLEQSLRLTQNAVTNLRINHHFLFNTLNCMADLALRRDADDLYEAIIDLSRMFRYTAATNERFVELSRELDYLNTYISLQKLRYGPRVVYEDTIDEELVTALVPINFLQPIVENAFIHGFQNFTGVMQVRFDVIEKDGRMEITVENNGAAMDETMLNKVRKRIKSNTGHGLSLINSKLDAAYDGNFTIDIQSKQQEKTVVKVTIPINRGGYKND